MKLAKQEQLAKFQPFLKTLVFSILRATLKSPLDCVIYGELETLNPKHLLQNIYFPAMPFLWNFAEKT